MIDDVIRTTVLLLIATFFVPHVQAQEASVSTSMDDEKSKRIGTFLDAYVPGKFEASEDIFQEGVRFLWADFSDPHGIDEWNEAVTAHHAAFDNIELRNRVVTTSDYDDYGIWTYVWTIWSGTNRATGEDFRLPLHIMYQWEGDQVAREFAYFIWNGSAPRSNPPWPRSTNRPTRALGIGRTAPGGLPATTSPMQLCTGANPPNTTCCTDTGSMSTGCTVGTDRLGTRQGPNLRPCVW